MTSSRFFVFFTLLLLLCSPLSLCHAQQDNQQSQPALEPVPAERATPRATMQTFLKGWGRAESARGQERRDEMRRIISTLDLGEIPPPFRLEQGETLAFELKTEVIDKFAYIDYDTIPDDPNAPPYVVLESPKGLKIVIAPDERGDWRFTRASVSNIPRIAAEFAEREQVEGAIDVASLKPPAVQLREQLPDWMNEPALVLYVYQWIGIAVLALAALIIGRATVFLLILLLGSILRRRGIASEEEQRYILNWPMGLVISVFLWWSFDGWLGLPPGATKITQYFATIVFGVSAIVMLYRIINVVCSHLGELAQRTDTKFDDLLVPFVRKSAKIVVLIVGPLMILDNLGMDLKTALGTLAIGGLAISLAAKDTVSNLFGTITIIGDCPFQIGDWIKVADVEGTVESLGFRSTRVRTFYNSLVTIPNANLTNAVVDNYGMRRYRRYLTHLGIAYNTPTERVEAFCEGIREIIRQHPYTRKDYYHVYFHEYGASSLNVLVYMFFETPDWGTELRERHRLNADMHRLARRLGVEFAFPTQTLYLMRGQEHLDPDSEPVSDVERLAARLDEAHAAAAHITERTGATRPTGPVTFTDPSTMTTTPKE